MSHAKKQSLQAKIDRNAKIEQMLQEHYLIGKGQVAQDFKLQFARSGKDKPSNHRIPINLGDEDLDRADLLVKLLAADDIEINKQVLFRVLIQFGLVALEMVFKDHYGARANDIAQELAGMTDMLHPTTRQELRKALLESSVTSKAPGTQRKHKPRSPRKKTTSPPKRG